MRKISGIWTIAALIAALIAASAIAGRHGPFDYTNPKHVRDKLPIVEKWHFSRNVENLIKGDTASIVGDLAYVLRSFPNHHRALNSMARLWRESMQKNAIPHRANASQTPEYWFDKAISFAPHDGTVRLVYGIHLHKLKKFNQALALYKQAEELLPNSPEVHYNTGLLYVAKGDYDKAKVHATKAYSLGYPLSGLRNKLIAAGAWKP